MFKILFLLAMAGAQQLPVTPAEALSGEKLQFPTALAGKTAICVIGFSKEAGDRSKVWMERLTQDGLNAWSVAELEKAPAFIRGMIRSGMRKATPPARLSHSLVLTKDSKAWETAVGLKQESQPVVVLLDPAGRLLWTYEGPLSDAAYAELKQRAGAVK